MNRPGEITILERFQISPESDLRILETIGYMWNNVGRNLTIREIAKHSGLSLSRLGHLFVSAVKQPPKKVLLQMRMARAKELLTQSDVQIKEIAGILGFSRTSSFDRCFKAECGVTPREFRRALQDEPTRRAPGKPASIMGADGSSYTEGTTLVAL